MAGAAALWGTAGTAQELLLPEAPPVAIAAIRCIIGGGVLLVIALAPARRASLLATVRHGGAPLWSATAAMTVFQACYLLGIRSAGVALGTLVALGSAPAWAGMLAAATGRRPRGRWVAATGLAVAGLALLVRADAGAAPISGVALAAVAGAAYGTYTTTSARLRVTDRGAVVAVTFTVCGLVLLPSLAVTGGIPVDADAVVGLAWLAVATTIVAYRLFLRGLVHLDAPAATTLSLLEPLTATLLAVTLVGERLTGPGVVGVAALLVGVAVASGPDATPPAGHLASQRPRTGSGP